MSLNQLGYSLFAANKGTNYKMAIEDVYKDMNVHIWMIEKSQMFFLVFVMNFAYCEQNIVLIFIC